MYGICTDILAIKWWYMLVNLLYMKHMGLDNPDMFQNPDPDETSLLHHDGLE